ncbi:MAG: DUF2844 domain-containing protein [Bdellovibrionia bacterium]
MKIEMDSLRKSFVLVTGISIFITSLSFASLGQRENSIKRDGLEIHARISERFSQSLYQVYTLTSDMNEVRQYLDNQGIVFAVTWRGINHPDLSKLLGEFFRGYAAADAEVSGSRDQPIKRINTEEIVVEKGGHMGAVRGKAYLSKSVPAGVEIDSLN